MKISNEEIQELTQYFSDEECRKQVAMLVKFFRGPGHRMELVGDEQDWSLAETAIVFLESVK